MKLTEKAAYLKGLMEGLGIDESTKEGKVLKAMSELLAEMADAIQELDQDVDQVFEDVDTLCGELEDLEDDLYDEEDDEDDDDEEEEEDDEDEDGEDDSTDPCYEVDCPACGETVYVSEEDLEAGEAFCTNCGRSFGIELEADEEEAEEKDKGCYEVTCPACGEVSVMEEDALLDGSARCPACGQPIELEVSEEE